MAIQGTDGHGQVGPVRVDQECTGRTEVINPQGLAVAVETPKDRPLEVREYRNTVNLNPLVDNSHAVGFPAATEYTLPTPGGRYILIATGGTVWIRETVAAVADAAGMVCPDGIPIGPIRIMGPTVSTIATAGNRVLYFVEVLD